MVLVGLLLSWMCGEFGRMKLCVWKLICSGFTIVSSVQW